MNAAEAALRLGEFVSTHRRLLVLTGAGCSVASGIPDYRDARGDWKHARPVMFRDFMDRPAVRQRYWARSFAGWPRFARAAPNAAHQALARLEAGGAVTGLITQNVDGLHQRAGQRAVIDLHGRLELVRCMGCGTSSARALLQERLQELNPAFTAGNARPAPDGDAEPEAGRAGFRVPDCDACGGILKPDVVFFGEAIPRERVEASLAAVAAADALLVVGSSLMVFSGYRLVRSALQRGIPVLALNLGRTRADTEIPQRLAADCVATLDRVRAA